jgi:hypothetical protein
LEDALSYSQQQQTAYSTNAGHPIEDVSGMRTSRARGTGVGQIDADIVQADFTCPNGLEFVGLQLLEVGQLWLIGHARADGVGMDAARSGYGESFRIGSEISGHRAKACLAALNCAATFLLIELNLRRTAVGSVSG